MIDRLWRLAAVPALFVSLTAFANEPPAEPPEHWVPISSTMEEIPYPHPVHYMDVTLFGQAGKLAYMDVAPTSTPNGQTAMLFHGMNFAGIGFAPTIDALTDAGFRVVVPDRIGYGRSSKLDIPYNLNMVVSNAKALLDHLGIEQTAIVGHSMGGMVAARFAMVYGDTTTHVAFVNQIGMADQRLSRPWRDHEEVYEAALNASYESILRNHMLYYNEGWRDEYLDFVYYQYGQTLTSEWPRLARIRAWQQMIMYFDPVVYDWQHIDSKAIVIGGELDRLTPNFADLARNLAETLQNAELKLYPGIGHNPHFEWPEEYHADLIEFLSSDPDEPARSDWR
jgi:pimeloyl-ACP methyl ester carboxylesterase